MHSSHNNIAKIIIHEYIILYTREHCTWRGFRGIDGENAKD